MAERDLKLNAIRTVKQSPNLVLEEHGHCEVPAGCGGVVLRWRQRSRLPIQVWLHTAASKTVYLDGDVLTSGRPLIGPGEHVLALDFSRVDPAEAVLMAACFYDENPTLHHTRFTPSSGRKFYLVSLADGTWKYTTEASLDDPWMRPGYDDSAWRPMIARDFPEPAKGDWATAGRIKRIVGLGGQGLGIDLPTGPTSLLVRRAFRLDPA
jgi:hypothetical protein